MCKSSFKTSLLPSASELHYVYKCTKGAIHTLLLLLLPTKISKKINPQIHKTKDTKSTTLHLSIFSAVHCNPCGFLSLMTKRKHLFSCFIFRVLASENLIYSATYHNINDEYERIRRGNHILLVKTQDDERLVRNEYRVEDASKTFVCLFVWFCNFYIANFDLPVCFAPLIHFLSHSTC